MFHSLSIRRLPLITTRLSRSISIQSSNFIGLSQTFQPFHSLAKPSVTPLFSSRVISQTFSSPIQYTTVRKMSSPAAPTAAYPVPNDVYRRFVLTEVTKVCPIASVATAFDVKSAVTTAEELFATTEIQAALDATKLSLVDFQAKIEESGLSYKALSPTGLFFSLTEEGLKSLSDEILYNHDALLNQVGGIAVGQHTFANTLGLLAEAERVLSPLSSIIVFLSHVHPAKATRDVTSELSKAISAFGVKADMRVDVYKSVKAFSETEEAKQLTGESKRYLDFTVRDYRRSGLHLEEEKRKRVEEIKTEMGKLAIEFSKNLGEENSKYEFTKEQLDGLSEDTLESFEKSAEGKYIVTLQYPHYFPVMDKCKVDATRQTLERAYNSRCKDTNGAILQRIVDLRNEQCSLLGYPTHAAFVLEPRMAKTPEAVKKFLDELSEKLNPLVEKELAYWLELKKQIKAERNEPFDGVIHPYDFRFYNELSTRLQYQVDEDAMKPYFPLETVVKGLFGIYEELLGLKFHRVADHPAAATWHPDVTLWEVREATAGRKDVGSKQGDTVGYFYMDLHPREGKYGHAAVFTIKDAAKKLFSNGRQLPTCAVVCNFSKPQGNKPALLKHDEVNTFFHEFGHCVHVICSEAQYARFAGTSVERDFVEAPSQMLENWTYEKEALSRMSGHYERPDEKLPVEMIEKLKASQKANAGFFNKRQIILGSFDQEIHTVGTKDLAATFAEISKKHWPIVPTPDTNFAAGFGHLAGGYDASYYGYLWSEVFSMDMFESRFNKEGILNPATGLSYRDHIISRGGSVDGADMLRNFLGRDPIPEPFLKSKGL